MRSGIKTGLERTARILRRVTSNRILRRMLPERAGRSVKRALAVAGACAFAALMVAAGLPALHRFYAIGWIPAHWYHPVFAALCVLPAAIAHAGAAYSGARGAAWWLAWLPGIAVYAAFPWPAGGSWQPIWIFGHAWDWARTIFLHYDTAPPFVFNSFGAFVGMLTVTLVAGGKLWLGMAKAAGRLGRDSAAAAEDALPSAKWASRGEVVDRFSVSGGIVLGELTDPVKDSPRFAPGRPLSWGGQGSGHLITMSPTDGNGHVLVTSQASGYKSTGLVIPNILTYNDPIVVFDPKCELYARTRKAREDMNFKPVVIDADNGFDPARLIAALAEDHPSAYLRMAKMMIPKGHGGIENSAYFKAAATNLFTALLAHHGEAGSPCILQDIAELLAHSPDEIYAEVAEELGESKLPFVQNQLNALEGMDPKFWSSIKTEITNQLLFSEMPDVARYITMKEGSKLASQVLDPRCDIFLNIPQNVAEDFAPMLRLMLGSMLTAAEFIEVNEAPRARRLFLIDEAAKLGNMDILENIRDRGRSLGLHLMMFYQTPGEIERLWGRAGMTSWKDGCSATIMGPVSSRTSAGEVSAMIGTRTLRVRTESTSSSSQVLSPMSGNVSKSENEQLRDVPVISPTEISQLPRHASIITASGTKPILASKAIWFTREDMKGRARSTEDIKGDLAVNKARDALIERLDELTQSADEVEADWRATAPDPVPSENETPDGIEDGEDGEPALSKRAKARRLRSGRARARQATPRDIDPGAAAIEEDFVPAWAKARSDLARDPDSAPAASAEVPTNPAQTDDSHDSRLPEQTTHAKGTNAHPSPLQDEASPDDGDKVEDEDGRSPEPKLAAPMAAKDIAPDEIEIAEDVEARQAEVQPKPDPAPGIAADTEEPQPVLRDGDSPDRAQADSEEADVAAGTPHLDAREHGPGCPETAEGAANIDGLPVVVAERVETSAPPAVEGEELTPVREGEGSPKAGPALSVAAGSGASAAIQATGGDGTDYGGMTKVGARADAQEPGDAKPERDRGGTGRPPSQGQGDESEPPEAEAEGGTGVGGETVLPQGADDEVSAQAGESDERASADAPPSEDGGDDPGPPEAETVSAVTGPGGAEPGEKPATAAAVAWTTAEGKRFASLVQDDMSFAEIAADMGKSMAEVKAWSDGQLARGLVAGSAGDPGGKQPSGTEGDGPG